MSIVARPEESLQANVDVSSQRACYDLGAFIAQEVPGTRPKGNWRDREFTDVLKTL
jgi:hypothetical protein